MNAPTPLSVDSPVGSAQLYMGDGRPQKTVVLCHGLPSGNPPDPTDAGYPGIARDLSALGVAAVTFNFRGCHGSPGDLSLAGLVEDLAAVIRSASKATDAAVYVVGSSLGGAVALLEAADDEAVVGVATLAAPADFHSLSDDPQVMVDRFSEIGLFSTPGYPENLQRWAAEFAEADITAAAARLSGRELMIVHGTADDVVPVDHARRIAHAAPTARLELLEGSGHQLRRDPAALDLVGDWVRD